MTSQKRSSILKKLSRKIKLLRHQLIKVIIIINLITVIFEWAYHRLKQSAIQSLMRLFKRDNKEGSRVYLTFCMRVSLKIVNRGAIETLILAGAFDEFGIERASLLASVDQAIEQGELFGGLEGEDSLFGDALNLEDDYQKVEPFELLEKLSFEKELLGVYISDHPLEVNRRHLRANGIMDFHYFYQQEQVKDIRFATLIQDINQILHEAR